MQRAPARVEPSQADNWSGANRDEIILKYAPLVKFVANRIAMRLPPGVDQDDLIQVGILGLIDAVAKFEPERGIKFQTYAEFRIRGAILDELRALDWVPRTVRHAATQLEEAYQDLEGKQGSPVDDEVVATHMGLSLQEYYDQLESVRSLSIISFEDLRPAVDNEEWDALEMLEDPSVEDPLEAMGLEQMRQALGAAIGSLPEKERLVVTLYYFEELTMSEIGHVLGLTESRISQLHSKATLRIRARMKKYFGRKE
ncbi:MAG: FliA/WhiG family RNA polymerase sigma factor [Magnetococcales bacterium]|nr:FliA/WhiG family RNA polymerase sigma factor [Magnetococcales bacterium]